jgi:cyclophilin family peptidyl-prolyl cis-trans isomerase
MKPHVLPRRHRGRPRRLARLALGLLLAAATAAAGTLVQFRTVFGDIELELYDADKPLTVANFIRYVESGRYADGIAHRLYAARILQGGGYVLTNRGATNATLAEVPVFGLIPNEFGVGPRLSNVFGTIAMAKRAGDTNSAGSQWYFNLKDNTELDAPDTNNMFVVFGRVVRGTGVLEAFTGFQPWQGGTAETNIVRWFGGAFSDFPLLAPDPVETNLIFMDISLLQVAVAPVEDGGRAVSWKSVDQLTNRVEFTAGFPPAWQTLAALPGTGQRLEVLDPSPDAASRFYRVRIEYPGTAP